MRSAVSCIKRCRLLTQTCGWATPTVYGALSHGHRQCVQGLVSKNTHVYTIVRDCLQQSASSRIHQSMHNWLIGSLVNRNPSYLDFLDFFTPKGKKKTQIQIMSLSMSIPSVNFFFHSAAQPQTQVSDFHLLKQKNHYLTAYIKLFSQAFLFSFFLFLFQLTVMLLFPQDYANTEGVWLLFGLIHRHTFDC